MRWQMGRRSQNVEDRRGMRIGRGGVVGGGVGMVILALVAMFLGVDPSVIFESGTSGPPGQSAPARPSPQEDQQAQFVSVVLAETEDVWRELFARSGWRYQDPTLVLFSGATQSGCGFARSAVGPFYCPLDEKLYLDLDFFDELSQRFGAPGDFARAYVVAHEVGHHVQNLMGVLPKIHDLQQRVGQTQANKLSVLLELQADCLAGVWAHRMTKYRDVLDEGDVDEAVKAAESVGDDRLQRRGQGYVVPDSFTHGTSAQRAGWFKAGLRQGEIGSCDTFGSDGGAMR